MGTVSTGLDTPRSRTLAPRRGSFASDKQVAFAVRESKLVRATLPGSVVEGYVLASDDYHWVVVDRDLAVHLVHKTVACFSVLPLTLAAEPEEVRETIESMVSSYRDRVLSDHFSATA